MGINFNDFNYPLVLDYKEEDLDSEFHAETSDLISMPPRRDLIVLYTRRFVIRAHVHPGGEMAVTNFLNVMGGSFFPATGVQFHPVVPTRELPVDYARLMIVNKGCVDFFHTQE